MEALNMSACLVIRAPNQKFGDQPVDCPLDWSVQQLKQHLSKVYPSKPRPEDQKLIYSGQLLENQMSLKDVFRLDTGQTHILHLVCRSSRESPESSHSAIPLKAASQSGLASANSSVTSMPSTSSVGSTIPSPSSDGLRHRSTSGLQGGQAAPNGQFPLQFPGLPAGAVPAVASPEQMMQQMAVAQQLYAQYFTQYMQFMSQGGVPVARPAAPPVTAEPVPPAMAPAAPVAPNNVAAVARPAQDNRGLRMNAQGGPLLDEEDDDAAQRDWLDWIYTLSRATILLGIVYYYSSFGRFLVVTGMAVLAYLYQGGWFAAQRRQQQREEDRNRAREVANNGEPNAAPAEPRPAAQPEPQAAHERPQRDANEHQLEEMMDGDLNEDAAVPAVPEERVSPITMMWTVVTTFFTSLIPEQPPPVNVN
ncbi:unnamed protein product [Ixodes hexagonus]